MDGIIKNLPVVSDESLIRPDDLASVVFVVLIELFLVIHNLKKEVLMMSFLSSLS
jgi:hypothetical protein